jgi:hypothetical protein
MARGRLRWRFSREPQCPAGPIVAHSGATRKIIAIYDVDEQANRHHSQWLRQEGRRPLLGPERHVHPPAQEAVHVVEEVVEEVVEAPPTRNQRSQPA